MNRIFAWFVFNTALGFVFAVLLYRNGDVPFAEVLMLSQICVHLNSSVCAGVLYWRLGVAASGRQNQNDPSAVAGHRLRSILPWTVATSVLVSVPAAIISVAFFSQAIYGTSLLAFAGISVVSVVVAIMITVVVVRLEEPAVAGRAGGEEDLLALSTGGGQSKPLQQALWIRDANGYLQLPADSILMLAAHKHVTVIHATSGDYRVPEGLNHVLSRLTELAGPSQRFLRVHRSFVLNVSRVVRLEHIAGGQYRAMLGDVNETEVPVGRHYSAALRQALGID